jgi:hypothetical protein
MQTILYAGRMIISATYLMQSREILNLSPFLRLAGFSRWKRIFEVKILIAAGASPGPDRGRRRDQHAVRGPGQTHAHQAAQAQAGGVQITVARPRQGLSAVSLDTDSAVKEGRVPLFNFNYVTYLAMWGVVKLNRCVA